MAFKSFLFLMTIIVLATAAALKDSAKDSSDGQEEKNDVFEDDSKRNLSEEVVMFGNQQNKAAGMIDDALVEGIKQNDEVSNAKNHKDDDDDAGSEAHHMKEKRVPIISESGIEHETDSDSTQSNDASDEDENLKMLDKYLGASPETDDIPPELNDRDVSYEDIMYGLGNGQQGWLPYPGFLDNNFRRFRRNAVPHHRGIRASLDQLLNGDRNARSKRDLHLTDEDLLNLLEELPQTDLENEVNSNEFFDEPILSQGYPNPAIENSQWNLIQNLLNGEPDERSENQEWPFVDFESPHKTQHSNFYPILDYSDIQENLEDQPLWEPLQERFIKRRLQSSEEEEDDNSAIINQSEVWPNGEELNDLYQRIVW